MTIQQLMQDMDLSQYRLSKISEIPWATISDIYSGKTQLDRCGVGILSKLSKALGLPVQKLLELESKPTESALDGKPDRKAYLEAGLSGSVQKAIKDYQHGEMKQVLHLDCLWGELYGAINADLWSGVLTEEQAGYLREKYLGLGGKEEGING